MQSSLKPESKFLTTLIPNNWVETIFEYENYFMIHVTGDATTEDEWENYVNVLKLEFGDNFDEVFRLPGNGTEFQFFLHKSNPVMV